MSEIRNLDNKRVCDIANDGKTAVIQLKDCKTIITANADGTLNIAQEKVA